LVGCGQNNEPQGGGPPAPEGTGPRPGDATDIGTGDVIVTMPEYDREQFYGQTIKIFSLQGHQHINSLIRMYMDENPDVMVMYSLFPSIAEGMWYTTTYLAAGTAPTIMYSQFIDYYNPNYARYLADWFPVMEASPYFDEDSFFMNVFHGAAVNSRLYAFPLSFSYRMVTANSLIPGLIESLDWYKGRYGGVTIPQLMEMMHVRHIPGSDMYFARYFDVSVGVWDYIHSFFDMDTRYVGFNSQSFIDLISNMQEITTSGRIFDWSRTSTHTAFAVDSVMSERYFFQFICHHILQYFVDFGETASGDAFMFTAPTPILNNQGELNIDLINAYVLNAQATTVEQAIALDFMLFIRQFWIGTGIDFRNLQIPRMLPVDRDMHYGMVTSNINNTLFNEDGHWGRWVAERGELSPEEREDIISQLVAIGGMPMTSTQVPHEIKDIIFYELREFHNGFVSAEDVAHNLYSRITSELSRME